MAEVVWTCTQPSAVDGEPVNLRYNIASSDEIIDEFSLHWRIVWNDDTAIVATFAWPPSDREPPIISARTLVIDPSNGNMVLAIIELDTREASRLIRGVCRKS